MKKLFCLIFFLLALFCMHANSKPANDSCCTFFKVADSLSEIAGSSSPMRYFAALYYQSTVRIEKYTRDLSPEDRRLLEREVYSFYAAVSKANKSYLTTSQPPIGSWQFYLSDTARSPLYYSMVGLNAHINGDSYPTLVQTYSEAELKVFKPIYTRLNRVLLFMTDSLYQEFRAINIFNRAHRLTAGATHAYVRYLLKYWRKQQYRTAQSWYQNSRRQQRLAKKAARRKARWDRFAARYF